MRTVTVRPMTPTEFDEWQTTIAEDYAADQVAAGRWGPDGDFQVRNFLGSGVKGRVDTARSAAAFATTHWSVVLEAGQSASTQADDALATLCQRYWYPLYAFLRRLQHPPADAEDLQINVKADLASH